MKIYKNPWVSGESYFIKTGPVKTGKYEAAKIAGYIVEFWNGRWIVRKAQFYNRDIAEMPIVAENKKSIASVIDKAILDAVLNLARKAEKETVQ